MPRPTRPQARLRPQHHGQAYYAAEQADSPHEDPDWEEHWVDVLRVRFSQEQIHPCFHRRGPIRDVLGEIGNEPAPEPLEASSGTVRLLPPFAAIRVVKATSSLHGDLITLDNRRLYALQLAAVERWPAKCVAKVRLGGLAPAELKKLTAGGLGPLGPHPGKAAALLQSLAGDVSVLLASRGSAWEAWQPAKALLDRCGPPQGEGGTADPSERARHALKHAWEELERERGAHGAILDAASVAAHARAHEELWGALELLRRAALEAPGVIVQRVGQPGDRDGYISVAARKAALARLGIAA